MFGLDRAAVPTTPPSILRSLLALLLAVAVQVGGMGMALARTDAAREAVPSIPGVVVHICHSGTDAVTPGPDHALHDCCDVCALCCASILPEGPDLTAPRPIVHVIAHRQAMGWAPRLSRPRSNSLARAPPAAG